MAVTEDLLIFAAMLGLAVVFHWLESVAEERWNKAHPKDKGHYHKCSAVLMAGLAHPATWSSFHDFMVHIVIYSGKVIPVH